LKAVEAGVQAEIDALSAGADAPEHAAVMQAGHQAGVQPEGKAMEDGYTSDTEASAAAPLEVLVWDASRRLSGAQAAVANVAALVEQQQAVVAAALEAYLSADSNAAAAMEAAEDAVRDEMETIAVCNETASALTKAIEGLRYLDNTSERQEEDFVASIAASIDEDDVTMTTAAAAATRAAADVATRSSAAGLEALEAAVREADTGPRLGQRFKAALLSAWRNRFQLLGFAALAAVAVAGLQYFGTLGWATDAARAAVAPAARLWAVFADLVSRLPLPHVHESEAGILETIWLLLASVFTVPLVCKFGGSPVLGFLAGGALIGPYALGIIQDVSQIRHLAELGVVFLLFNIGLELSFDRLRSMGKFVFGMGSAQVVLTLAAVAYTAQALSGGALGGPAAIILGGGLALSTTAVGMQVLQDRGENGSRHGRAAFSVLLFQDLAVVVLLMLVPLLAPSPDGAAGGVGLMKLAKAIGFASVKAVACMAAIIVAGRSMLQPLYKRVADTNNPDIFNAMTLLVVSEEFLSSFFFFFSFNVSEAHVREHSMMIHH
jgi:hypothetical protein